MLNKKVKEALTATVACFLLVGGVTGAHIIKTEKDSIIVKTPEIVYKNNNISIDKLSYDKEEVEQWINKIPVKIEIPETENVETRVNSVIEIIKSQVVSDVSVANKTLAWFTDNPFGIKISDQESTKQRVTKIIDKILAKTNSRIIFTNYVKQWISDNPFGIQVIGTTMPKNTDDKNVIEKYETTEEKTNEREEKEETEEFNKININIQNLQTKITIEKTPEEIEEEKTRGSNISEGEKLLQDYISGREKDVQEKEKEKQNEEKQETENTTTFETIVKPTSFETLSEILKQFFSNINERAEKEQVFNNEEVQEWLTNNPLNIEFKKTTTTKNSAPEFNKTITEFVDKVNKTLENDFFEKTTEQYEWINNYNVKYNNEAKTIKTFYEKAAQEVQKNIDNGTITEMYGFNEWIESNPFNKTETTDNNQENVNKLIEIFKNSLKTVPDYPILSEFLPELGTYEDATREEQITEMFVKLDELLYSGVIPDLENVFEWAKNNPLNKKLPKGNLSLKDIETFITQIEEDFKNGKIVNNNQVFVWLKSTSTIDIPFPK